MVARLPEYRKPYSPIPPTWPVSARSRVRSAERRLATALRRAERYKKRAQRAEAKLAQLQEEN